MKILFMCVANSARSQMAEGLAKAIFKDRAEIQSAGSEPKFVHPMAKLALQEIGIDISSHNSKSWGQLPAAFQQELDLLITLCAEEVCPLAEVQPHQRLHWPLPDPAVNEALPEVQLQSFRRVRDELITRINALASTATS